MKMRIVFVIALLFATTTMNVHAIPEMISYQGKVHVDGVPFTGTGYFRFEIIDESEVCLWSNDGEAPPTTNIPIPVDNGLFSIKLGDETIMGMDESLPSQVFTDDNLCLRIWFDDGTTGMQQLTPDQKFTSVAFSHNSDRLDLLDSAQLLRCDQDGVFTGDLFIDGKLGIGISEPESQLEVNGSISLSHNPGEEDESLWGISPWHTDNLGINSKTDVGVLHLVRGNDAKVVVGYSNSPPSKFNVNGTSWYNGRIQVVGNANPEAGAGLELGYDSGEGIILSYNRNDSEYKTLRLNGSNIIWQTSSNTRMVLTSSGSLGIKTTDPGAYELYVNGQAIVSSNFRVNGKSYHMNGLGVGTTDLGSWELNLSGQARFSDYVSVLGGLHVGGTSDPGTDNLVVDGEIKLLNNKCIRFKNTSGSHKGVFGVDNNNRVWLGNSALSNIIFNDHALPYQNGSLKLGNSATRWHSLWISEKVHCGGKLGDLAESVKYSEQVEAGDVIAIDEENGGFKLCDKAYCHSVAGIASGTAKLVIGESEEKNNDLPLSLSGMVYCKVSDINGSIKTGDLLTSSDIPGFAMKAVIDDFSKTGTVIAKALEPLDEGEDKIKVLVWRQ